MVGASPAAALSHSAPDLEFLSNPLSDYLHLLFFRKERERFKPFQAEGFAAAPRLDHLITVPETAASAGLTRYEDLLPFVAREFSALPATRLPDPRPRMLSHSDNPPGVEEVLKVIAAGAPFYEPFFGTGRQRSSHKWPIISLNGGSRIAHTSLFSV